MHTYIFICLFLSPSPTSSCFCILSSTQKEKPSLMADNSRSCETRGANVSVREQDRLMPIANVIRIMRKVLPGHSKIADDAKETIQECVSEFVSFITSEANDKCQLEQRRTITANDIMWALCKLGFDDYIEPLLCYLERYRQTEGDHRCSLKRELLPTIKKEANVGMCMPYSCNTQWGLYRDVETSVTAPFDPFSQYNI